MQKIVGEQTALIWARLVLKRRVQSLAPVTQIRCYLLLSPALVREIRPRVVFAAAERGA